VRACISRLQGGPYLPSLGRIQAVVTLVDVALDRRDLGSWLPGPDPSGASGSNFPGERLGRPEHGPRSLAGPGRRFCALLIDWVICLVIARGFFGPEALRSNGSLVVIGVLVIENLLLVPAAGATIGLRVVGLQVERVDGARIGVGWAAVRAVLIGLALPAVTMLWEPDRRGLQDVLSGSVVAFR
jgi:uncharacterized RDD family membrane protein YckC